MYNEVAFLLPDKEKKESVVNTGVKLLIRNLECIERKHTLVLAQSWHASAICSGTWEEKQSVDSHQSVHLYTICGICVFSPSFSTGFALTLCLHVWVWTQLYRSSCCIHPPPCLYLHLSCMHCCCSCCTCWCCGRWSLWFSWDSTLSYL